MKQACRFSALDAVSVLPVWEADPEANIQQRAADPAGPGRPGAAWDGEGRACREGPEWDGRPYLLPGKDQDHLQ